MFTLNVYILDLAIWLVRFLFKSFSSIVLQGLGGGRGALGGMGTGRRGRGVVGGLEVVVGRCAVVPLSYNGKG